MRVKKEWMQRCFLGIAAVFCIGIMQSKTYGNTVCEVSDATQLQQALNEAKENATAENPYEIVISNDLTIENAMMVYSNTTITVKDGVTISLNRDSNMLHVGDYDDENAGYYYKNITINGGTWNGKNHEATLFKAAHCENFSMNHVTLQNVKDNHMMEVAALKGLNVTNCTFQNQTLATDAKVLAYEAIQLDITVEGHFGGYRNEDLPVEDVKITGCTFDNVPRGVGSHTGILNHPIKNVTIDKCSFTNIKSCAIQLVDAEQVTITNNKIASAPRGITVYSSVFGNQDVFPATAIDANSTTSTKYETPNQDMKIVITDNEIVNSSTDPYAKYGDGGICVSGQKLEKDAKNENNLPLGDYYISGVTIKNNKIQSKGYGIKVADARNTVVENNTMNYTAENPGQGEYGLSIRDGCDGCTFQNNTMNGFGVGAYVTECASADILSNTIQNMKKHGIQVSSGNAGKIANNTIEKPDTTGIIIFSNGNADSVTANKIVAPGKYGIAVDIKCKVPDVTENEISDAMNGIYIRGGKVSNIQNNNISGSRKYGIGIDNKAEVAKIAENTISQVAVTGIYVQNSTVTNVEKNDIKDCKKNGIATNKAKIKNIVSNEIADCNNIGVYALRCETTNLSKNTITAAKDGLKIGSSKIKKVQNNTITSKKANGINIASNSKVDLLKKNKLKKCKQYGIYIASSCKVKKIIGNSYTKCKKKIKK